MQNDNMSTNDVRDLLATCGIPKASTVHVQIVARKIGQGAERKRSTASFWVMLIATSTIRSVVQKALKENEVISSVRERMELMKLEDPTPEMGQQLSEEWVKVLNTLR